MDFLTGKPDHIEDYLATVRSGQWFGFSDPINKTYANLIVHDGGTKPTEKEVTDGLAAMQAEWALEHDSYRLIHGNDNPSNVYLNRTENDNDQSYMHRAVSTITIMEIAP